MPQSPLSRRYQAIRQQQQQGQFDDDGINDDEIQSSQNYTHATPQRRQPSTTRATTNLISTSNKTPSFQTPGVHNTTTRSTAYHPQQHNTTVGNISMIGGQRQQNNDHVANFAKTNEITFRDLFFQQAEALETQWAIEDSINAQ